MENLTKQTLRLRFSEGKARKCYKIDQLKKMFTDGLGADLTKVAGFKEIDEIRELDNEVKHGGKPPEPALKSYGRLVEAVGRYLHDIAIVVLPEQV